ncbi:MAG: hypothetical protein FWG01_03640 [Betaproteobacteria bacterium]|nr:hypothetical protein [Betaproteobacteria bacterium]
MPTEQHDKLVTFALKACFFLFFSVIFSFSHAASLGQLTVLSSLGQPLHAEIELLSVSPDEAPLLTVSLAPREAYQKSDIDYTPFLQSLNISIEKRGSHTFARITSSQPVNEPYIGILLELSTGQERKGREYVIVLDPAERRAVPLTSAAAMQRFFEWQRANREDARVSQTATKSVSVSGEKEIPASTEYVVARGDTLSKIAGRLGNRNTSLEQMLVMLYRNNPDAFLNNNMNLLREGAVLSVPGAGAAGNVSQREAKRLVRLHAANFRRYSQRLAGMVQKSSPGATGRTGPVAEGKVTARVKEQLVPAVKSPDRLELSKAGTAPAAITAEEKIAMNRAIEDANRRITELEKNVSELRDLLTIVSKNGHAATQPAETAAKAPPTQPETAKPQETESKDTASKTEADSPQTVTGTVEKTPSSEPKEGTLKEEGISSDQTLAKSEKKAESPEKKEENDKNAEAEKEKGFLYNLKNNIVWHAAIGATAALIFLIALIMWMRRKKPEVPLKSAPTAPLPPKKEKVEDINPNIISGRDYLDNLPAREVMDDDDDIELEDVEDIEEEPVTEFKEIEEVTAEPEEVVEEVVSEPEEIEEIEEIPAEPDEEDVMDMAVSEPETDEIDDGNDNDDLAALQLDDSDELAVEESEEETDAKEPPPLELDLSDINLELENDAENELPDMAASAEQKTPEPQNAEMAAKLELALAYIDMKDKEGARELLEEIIERGTPRQIMEAQQAMQYL